ncbi:MAG: M48 family metallopeptidase [Thermoplasmatota archaeon]
MLPEEHIRRNKQATLAVCLFMLILFFSIIFAFGYALGFSPILSFAVGLPVALLYVALSYTFSVKSVLSAAKARPANPRSRREKLFLYKVEEMAVAAGLPVPEAYVQESSDINAFATGKHPGEAIICVTTGALEKLNGEELEGVMSHEMSHIANRDILVSTVTVGVVGAIALIAEILLRSFFFGAGRQRGKHAAPLIIVAIIFAVLAPLLSRLAYLFMSRRREYLADANGAMLTRNPDGLASALEKIRADLPDDPKGSRTVAPLYIANPFKRSRRGSLWATHPPLEERIKRLTAM